jgi:hypothetical protein
LYWPGALHAVYIRGWRTLPLPVEFCLVWVAVVFVFFTVSAAKLATYLLPIFPPLALLTAVALREAFVGEPPPARVRGYRLVFHGLEALALGLGVTTVVMGWLFWPGAILSGLAPLLLVAPVPVVLGHWLLRTRRPSLLVPNTFLLMVLLVLGFYGWFAPWLNDVFSLATPARLTGALPPERRVLTVDSPAGSLSFYLAQPVPRLATLAEAAAHLTDAEPTAIVTKTKRLPELVSFLRSPAYVWWESPRIKVLVVNRPPPEGSGIPLVPLSGFVQGR